MRRQSGSPGLSVNWGGWAETGMAEAVLNEKGGLNLILPWKKDLRFSAPYSGRRRVSMA